MAVVPIFGGLSVGESIAFNVTTYAPIGGGRADTLSLAGGETARQTIWRTAGTLANPKLTVQTNTIATSDTTWRLRINGGDGNAVVTVPAGSTGTFSGSGSDAIAAGDKLCWQLVTPNTSGAITITAYACSFAASSNTVNHYNNAPATAALNGVTRYWGAVGDLSAFATESQVQIKFKIGGTLKHFGVNVFSNARAVVDTFTLRIGSVDTALTVSTTASTTAFLEDTTHSVTINSGDLISLAMVAGASANSLGFIFSFEFETTDGTTQVFSSSGNNTAANLTRYKQFGPQAGNAANFTTESPTQVKSPAAGTLSLFAGNIAGNGNTGTSTFRPRVNTANGTLVLSVGSGVTGFVEDTTHSDAVAVDDLLDLQIITGATGTNIAVTGLSYVWTPAATSSVPVFMNQYRQRRA